MFPPRGPLLTPFSPSGALRRAQAGRGRAPPTTRAAWHPLPENCKAGKVRAALISPPGCTGGEVGPRDEHTRATSYWEGRAPPGPPPTGGPGSCLRSASCQAACWGAPRARTPALTLPRAPQPQPGPPPACAPRCTPARRPGDLRVSQAWIPPAAAPAAQRARERPSTCPLSSFSVPQSAPRPAARVTCLRTHGLAPPCDPPGDRRPGGGGRAGPRGARPRDSGSPYRASACVRGGRAGGKGDPEVGCQQLDNNAPGVGL